MKFLTIDNILKATSGELISRGRESFEGVSINSRSVKEGELFFALKGPRFDGHDFVIDAAGRSAGGFIVERVIPFTAHNSQRTIILVKDTLMALQDLAHFVRAAKDIPLVAVTGSNIGGLGSLEAIRSAKLEMLDTVKTVAVNADDSFLMEGVRGFRGEVITFSISNPSYIKAANIRETESGSRFNLLINSKESAEINLNVYGLFNVYNALAASAVALSFGMALPDIKDALERYRAVSMRFEVIKGREITLINDSYNANPSSMKEALNELGHLRGKGRLVAVLGNMNELGRFSEDLHRSVGKAAKEAGIDVFIAVGEMMGLAAEEIKRSKNGSHAATYTFNNISEAAENIMDIISAGDTVLVKGSRSMTMEKVVETILLGEGQK
ncbi:MAG: UDP-N-acetylmuramoyl-tripeptide--D-alanyl-D-alanine ligase [Nitrospirae bacterium]|nr:UDP-N-acetylmuramoyl-tripeptide--D-alanyl-D-alanine ligase [Nitrospirota bacterium]